MEDDFLKHVEEYNKRREKYEKRHRKRKPVVDISLDDIEVMWNYKFQAKYYPRNNSKVVIIASNSLNNLKEEIKIRGWDYAILTCTDGSFSHGQNIVDEYIYWPNYSYKRR